SRVVDVVEDRRLDEISAIERAALREPAAERHLRFLLPDRLVFLDANALLGADERPHFRVAVDPRPEFNRPRLFDHRVDELLVNRPLHENPAAGGADLALIEEDAEER